MVGAYVNNPATPSGVALSQARALLVCDAAGLRGTAGALVPAVQAWGADASGVLQRFWPGAPTINSFQTAAPSIAVGDWRYRRLLWSVAGASAISVSAHVGTGAPVTIYTGDPTAITSVEWDWFDADPQFQPGSTIVYSLTATGMGGSTTLTITEAAPALPPPLYAPNASSTTSSSTHLDWASAGVIGAVDYVVTRTPGSVTTVSATTNATLTGLAASTAYSFRVNARFRATYTGAVLLSGPQGPARNVTTLAPAETGPANGTYRIEPNTPATYQWGAGQPAGWRSTSDDFFHGDGSSYGSSRGQQGTFFFYTRPSAWSGGLGTKTCSRFQIYLVRQSGTGTTAGTLSRWGVHTYASKPSGAPTVLGSYDAGSLAWGAGAWIDLPTSYGAGLVAATYRGVVWGKVASRYQSADRNPSASTPNGTIIVTIAN